MTSIYIAINGVAISLVATQSLAIKAVSKYPVLISTVSLLISTNR